MSESRYRLSKPEKIAVIFARRRKAIRGLGIYSDESTDGSSGGTPFRWGTTPMTGVQSPIGGVGRGALGTLRSSIRHSRENVRPRSYYSRGRGTSLPSWYPRAPLRDITAVSRAIERKTWSLRETDSLQLRTPIPLQYQNIHEHYDETTPNAKVGHIGSSTKSPNLAGRIKDCSCPASVAKILHNVTSQKVEGENSDCITPQKKLLNSIDTVGKAVMEELDKIKKTPSARRAIRDRKIRTLMSMR